MRGFSYKSVDIKSPIGESLGADLYFCAGAHLTKPLTSIDFSQFSVPIQLNLFFNSANVSSCSGLTSISKDSINLFRNSVRYSVGVGLAAGIQVIPCRIELNASYPLSYSNFDTIKNLQFGIMMAFE